MFNYVQKNSRLRFWMIIDFFLSNFRHFSNFLQLLSNVSWEYVWKPVTNIMRIFPKFRKIMILFPSAIWPSRDQLWIIIEATASPTQFYSLFINYFKQKVSGSLVTRLGSSARPNAYWGPIHLQRLNRWGILLIISSLVLQLVYSVFSKNCCVLWDGSKLY